MLEEALAARDRLAELQAEAEDSRTEFYQAIRRLHSVGVSMREIADALGLAEGTVKRQLHAAVHRLREALSHARVTAGGRA